MEDNNDKKMITELLGRGASLSDVKRVLNVGMNQVVAIDRGMKAVAGDYDDLLRLNLSTLTAYAPGIEWCFESTGTKMPEALRSRLAAARDAIRKTGHKKMDAEPQEQEPKKEEPSIGDGLAIGMKVINDSINRVSGGLTDLYTLLKKNETAEDIESAVQVGFRLLSEQMKQQHEVMLNTIRSLAQDKKQADNANSDAAFAKLKSIEEKVEACKIAARRVAQS